VCSRAIKIVNFDQYLALSQKLYNIGSQLLWNTKKFIWEGTRMRVIVFGHFSELFLTRIPRTPIILGWISQKRSRYRYSYNRLLMWTYIHGLFNRMISKDLEWHSVTARFSTMCRAACLRASCALHRNWLEQFFHLLTRSKFLSKLL